MHLAYAKFSIPTGFRTCWPVPALCGVFLSFLPLTENHRRFYYLLTLLLFLAVALSLVSGSLWLICFSLILLAIKLYPIILVLLVAGGVGFLFFIKR
jgi:hypothetical protein